MHHLSGGHAKYLLLFGPHHGGDAADVRFVRPHAGERKEDVSFCIPSTVGMGKNGYFSIIFYCKQHSVMHKTGRGRLNVYDVMLTAGKHGMEPRIFSIKLYNKKRKDASPCSA